MSNSPRNSGPSSKMVVSDGLPEKVSVAGSLTTDVTAKDMSSAAAATMLPAMLPYMTWNPYMQFPTTEQLLAFTQMYGMLTYPHMASMLMPQTLNSTSFANSTSNSGLKDTESSENARLQDEAYTAAVFKRPRARSVSPPLKKALLQRYNGKFGFLVSWFLCCVRDGILCSFVFLAIFWLLVDRRSQVIFDTS